MKKLLIVVPVLLLVVGLALGFLLSATPSITLARPVRSIGNETPISLKAESPHGVRRVVAEVEQNGARHKVFERSNETRRGFLFRSKEPAAQIDFTAGKKQAQQLKDGPAQLIIQVVSNDFAGKSATLRTPVQVNTQPPGVSADGAQHYINQGGSELVTFNVSGYWTEAGVRVGKYTFRSFPMPGLTDPNASERFSIFAFPWDVPADTVPIVYARNDTGAEATARFWYKVFPKTFRARELPLDDSFLQKVTSELDPSGSGDLVQRFLKINGEMRRENNKTLSDMRLKSEPRILWSGPFFRIGQVESFFADQRSYLYKGKKIDQQMHLGFDLSDVQASPVKSANSGRVIHTGPLGIYGQCIVVDHGYGLQSIYGHLRQIDVKPGEMVAKEQVMGRSGATGLAGGDHIHFSLQVDGVQVNPLEWWDEHWIQDRILSKLPKQGATETKSASAKQ
ncbi:MAG TPA: M23 family metallopeptidase [Bryobacteraceae bacterium]|nr:M23 family metallopeptidase [Bryobacteraceae bacterium]